MRRSSLVVCFCLMLLMFPFVPVHAQENDERVTVRLDGRALFRVAASSDTDASSRAQRIERRLLLLLDNPQALRPAQIETRGADRLITVSDVLVVTVTENDAQDNVTTIDALALQWSQIIDSALQQARERRSSFGGDLFVEIRAAIETAFARMIESTITIVPRVLASILVLLVFWIIAALVRWMLNFFLHRFVRDMTVENLIKQLTFFAIWALGLLIAADALGFAPQTVITGLGLTGLALGFALKDIISNFISGILILALRPFRLGDQVVIGSTEGSVERIVIRATQIRTYDGRLVIVPNSEVFTSRITNNTASPIRRGSVTVALGYDTDLRRAVDIMSAATQSAAGVNAQPAANVRVQELTPEHIRVEARFWTDSRRSDFVATESAVRQALIDALKGEGIGLPEPALRVVRQETAA